MRCNLLIWLILLSLSVVTSPSIFAEDLEPSLSQTETSSDHSHVWLVPQVSIIMPRELSLTNREYSIPYSNQFANLSNFSIGMVSPLKISERYQLLALYRLGVTYKEGFYGFKKRSGESVESKVKLAWVPISVGGKIQYSIPDFPFIKPSLSFGGGVHWLYQTGNLGGMNSSFWVPYYFVTPALSFFEGANTGDWFGGFTFGVSYQNSFATQQTVKAWTFDLGINIFL